MQQDLRQMPERGIFSKKEIIGGEPQVLDWPIVCTLRQVVRIEKPPTVVAERVPDERPAVNRLVLDEFLPIIEHPAVAQARNVDRDRRDHYPREHRGLARPEAPHGAVAGWG